MLGGEKEMSFKETDLIENKDLRERHMERIDILEKVGNLLLLNELEMATTEMVAKFYEEEVGTIKMCVKNHRDEIESDGYKVWKKNDFNESKIDLLSSTKTNFTIKLGEEGFTISNRGLALFPKRAILRIGMLLQKSDVAKELRSRLLDIFHDAEHNTKIVENVFQEIRTEQEIATEMSQAILMGDFSKLSLLQTELIGIKNKRINKLENTVNILVDQYTTFDEFKRVANACMRAIASKDERPINKMWATYYKFLYDKEGISVNTRYKNEIERVQQERISMGKKPYTENTLKTKVNKLRTIKPSEYNRCLKVLEAMAVKYGVDIEEVVKLDFNK